MKEAKDYNPSKDPRLINCKTECGNDKCYARRYGLFAEKTCPNFVEPKPITKADLLRAMTDEELDGFLNEVQGDAYLVGFHARAESRFTPYGKRWLNWLKLEASE